MTVKTWLCAFGIFALGTQGGCLGLLFDGDGDDDGLKNSEEKDLGLDPKNADTDGDGLNDGAEVAAQTDPLVADTDGDGLLDGEEVNTYGTDPKVIDTDGDTYRDSDEITEGKDPLDPDDRIYEGYWPYNPNKDSLKQNEIVDDEAKKGKQFGRWTGKDQFGDKVDFYDLYNDSDIPVMLDISAEWCPPCNSMADFMASKGTGNDYEWIGADIDCGHKLRDAVQAGQLYWVTALEQDIDGGPATGGPNGGTGRWYDEHTDEKIPVMAESDEYLATYISLVYFPTLIYMDNHLTVKEFEAAPDPYNGALDQACADLP